MRNGDGTDGGEEGRGEAVRGWTAPRKGRDESDQVQPVPGWNVHGLGQSEMDIVLRPEALGTYRRGQ